MPFLETANPQINWKKKTLKVKYKGRLLEIPTLHEPVALTPQQPASPSKSVHSKNSFHELGDVTCDESPQTHVSLATTNKNDTPASDTPTHIALEPKAKK